MKKIPNDYSPYKHLIKERQIFWVSNGVVYEQMGQPETDHYDLELDPIGPDACGSAIELCRLFVGLIESITATKTPFLKKGISREQSTAIYNYFLSLHTGHYAYWSLVNFEEIPEELFQNLPLQKIPKIQYALLENKNDQLWVPDGYDLFLDDNNEKLDADNLQKGQIVSYAFDPDFPDLFSNDELEQTNWGNLNRVVVQFCKVLTENGVVAGSCEDLYGLYEILQEPKSRR